MEVELPKATHVSQPEALYFPNGPTVGSWLAGIILTTTKRIVESLKANCFQNEDGMTVPLKPLEVETL